MKVSVKVRGGFTLEHKNRRLCKKAESSLSIGAAAPVGYQHLVHWNRSIFQTAHDGSYSNQVTHIQGSHDAVLEWEPALSLRRSLLFRHSAPVFPRLPLRNLTLVCASKTRRRSSLRTRSDTAWEYRTIRACCPFCGGKDVHHCYDCVALQGSYSLLLLPRTCFWSSLLPLQCQNWHECGHSVHSKKWAKTHRESLLRLDSCQTEWCHSGKCPAPDIRCQQQWRRWALILLHCLARLEPTSASLPCQLHYRTCQLAGKTF